MLIRTAQIPSMLSALRNAAQDSTIKTRRGKNGEVLEVWIKERNGTMHIIWLNAWKPNSQNGITALTASTVGDGQLHLNLALTPFEVRQVRANWLICFVYTSIDLILRFFDSKSLKSESQVELLKRFEALGE